MNVFTVNERNTAKYSATLKDENGDVIQGVNLATLVVTLYNISDAGLEIINSRNAQDALNANDVTVDGDGLLEWIMQPADNVILDATKKRERHRALFAFTWDGGDKQGTHEVEFLVTNQDHFPAS